MSTEINVSVPYAGGNLASDVRTSWQAMDWCLIGGNNGRLGVTLRYQSNPNFLVCDVWELDEDRKTVDGRTILRKELVQTTQNTNTSYQLTTCRLNDTTFAVHQTFSNSRNIRIISVDPATYKVTQEKFAMMQDCGDYRYNNRSNNMTSYHSFQHFFMHPIEENKYLTWCGQNDQPYYRFVEIEWNPLDKTLGMNMICSANNRIDAPYNASWYRDNQLSGFDFGRDVAYLHEDGERYYNHSSTNYPTLHGNSNTTSSLFYSPTWIQSKKDRVGRVLFTCSYEQNNSGFQSFTESAGKYWTLVYTPEAIRSENEYPWTVMSGNGNFSNALRGNVSNYSSENQLGFAGWLPLYTKALKDDGQPLATKGELYCSKNLLVGKNSFRVMESTPAIPYGNNSQDSSNSGSNQRIIQTEWLDEDHFIVFYTNAAQYPDEVHLGTTPTRGVRYKIVHLIDDYMANVVGYGEITSPWFRGRLSEYMMPFKFSESNKVITSDAFQHLVSIWVPNSNPTVTNDTYTMVEDSVLTVSDVNLSVLVNDADLDGDTLTVSTNLVASPTFGSASINSDGTFTYTPNANFTGTDSFAYRALDGVGGFTDGIIYITVTPVADGPTTVSDVYTIAEDQTLTFSDINLGVLANDFDVDGDSLTIDTTPVNVPQNGSLTLNSDGTFHYTPNANFNGTDSFEYKVEDGTGNAETGTVTINVTAVNDSPVAVVDSFTMNEDETLTTSVSLLANDSDLDGDSLTVNTTPVVDVVNGTLTLNADGTFTYAPPANHYGSELFTYEVSDGNGGTAQASVTITIYALNDTPIPVSDSYSVDENSSIDVSLSLGLIANDTDLDGDTLTVDTTPVVDVSNGTLVLSSDGTFTYTPYANYWGSDSFTYRVTDGNGGAATTTVSITVTEVPNQAPVIAGVDSTYTLTQGQDTVITATATDVDGDAITWSYEESLGSASKYVFVAASYDDDSGAQSGSIYVYDANDLTSSPTKLIGEQGNSGQLGRKLAVNNTHLFAYDAQTVKAFDLSNLSAEPIVLGSGNDSFGNEIVCTSNKVVISAHTDDTVASNSGAIFVYDANDLSSDPVQLNGTFQNQGFGQYFTASDSKLIVGDPSWSNPNDQGGSHGAFDVYDMNNLTAAPTRIENHLLGHSQYLGKSMAISNGKIFVGNPGNGDHNNVGGSVLVYNENTLSFEQKITPSDAQHDGEFGMGITADSDYLVVTARKSSEQTGSVYVYDMNNLSGTPTKLTTSSTTDRFGYTQTSMTATATIFDGSLYIGAERGSNDNGIVYIYDLNNLSATPQELTASDANTYDNFGNSTAAITVTPTSQLNGVTVTQSDNVFTVTPAQQDATFQLTFTATDSEGNATSTTSDFDFTYVNQAPVVMGIEAVYTLTTGQDEVIVGLATDAEGDATTWSYEEVLASGVPSGLNGTTIAQNGDVFTITPGSANANFTLRFTATDSEGNVTSTDADFSHTYVAPVTTAPVAAGTWTVVTAASFANNYNGQAFIMRESGSNTTLSTPATGNMVGSSVAIGDDYVFVGNSHYDAYGDNAGAVFVFNKDTGSMVGTLQASTMSANTGFGSEDMSVAAGGNRIAVQLSKRAQIVGSPSESYGYGHIEIMNHDGTNRVEISHPDFDINQGYNNMMAFGNSTGWTANKFIASLRGSDTNGAESGSVLIYNLDGTLSTRLNGSAAGEEFGYDIATQSNHDKILVGIPGWNNDAGRVKLFDESGTEIMTIERPNSEAGAHGRADCQFGRNVAYGSGRIAVSELLDTSVGRVHIFDEADGSYINTVSGPRSDNFATGDIQIAGNYIFVSASGYNSNNGAFWVYDLDGNNGSRINNIGTSGFAHFGNKLAASVEE